MVKSSSAIVFCCDVYIRPDLEFRKIMPSEYTKNLMFQVNEILCGNMLEIIRGKDEKKMGETVLRLGTPLTVIPHGFVFPQWKKHEALIKAPLAATLV